jgi:hypothetical protein
LTRIFSLCFFGYAVAIRRPFFILTGESVMATQKKATKAKQGSKPGKKAEPVLKRTRPAKQTKPAKPTKPKDGEKPSMSEQLKEARQRYTKSKSAQGTASAHNGDDVATLLAGSSPEVVCSVAEKLAGLKSGELATQYGHLNPGQVRMCAGNRIRAMVKKDAVSVDDVAQALAAL